VLKGAYVLSKEQGTEPDVILIATGSEVELILKAQDELRKEKIDARVVSMPSWELFRMQDKKYRDEVLLPAVKVRVAIEAGVSQGWQEWIGESGKMIGINKFGSSAPYKDLYEHYGLTVKNIISSVHELIEAK
jgi:transketolase